MPDWNRKNVINYLTRQQSGRFLDQAKRDAILSVVEFGRVSNKNLT